MIYISNMIIMFVVLSIYTGFFAVINFVASEKYYIGKLKRNIIVAIIIAALLTIPMLQIISVADQHFYDENSSQRWLYSRP